MSTKVTSDFKLHTNQIVESGHSDDLNMSVGCVYHEATWANYENRDTSVTYNGKPTLKLSLEKNLYLSNSQVYAEQTLKPKFTTTGYWMMYYRFYSKTDAPTSELGINKCDVGLSQPGFSYTLAGGSCLEYTDRWTRCVGAMGSGGVHITNTDVIIASKIKGTTPYNVWIADLYVVLYNGDTYTFEQMEAMSDEELVSTFSLKQQSTNGYTNFSNYNIETVQIIENQYLNFNNQTYLKLFSHDIRNNCEMFKDTNDAKFSIDKSNRFSRLGDVGEFGATNIVSTTLSKIQTNLNKGDYYYFVYANKGNKDVTCNLKIVATKPDGKVETALYNNITINKKTLGIIKLESNDYSYADVYLDDCNWFLWNTSFDTTLTQTFGWIKSEDLLFGIGKSSSILPDTSSLGISYYRQVSRSIHTFLLNYSPTFGRLPTDYIELDYIESDGSQYIDTNVTLNMNTDGYDVKCQSTSSGQNGMVLGDWVNGSYYYWLYYYTGSSSVRMYLTNSGGTQLYYETGIVNTNMNPITYKFHKKCMYTNDELIHSRTDTFATPQGTCTLFRAKGSSGDGYTFKGRIYYCKLYQNGNLVRDLVPAKHRTTGVLGMYDILNNHFYQNVGSGTFIAGPVLKYNIWEQLEDPLSVNAATTSTSTMSCSHIEGYVDYTQSYGIAKCDNGTGYLDCKVGVSPPKGYTKLEYIIATGTQYIDSGYASSSGIRAVYKASFNTGGYIVGSHNLASPYGRNGCYLRDDGLWEFGYGETCPGVGSGSFGTIYEVDFKTTSSDAYLKVKGGAYKDWTTLTTGSGQSISSLNNLVFYNQYTQNAGGACTKARLYYLKVYNSAGSLVRDFIPVLNNSTNEIGLYDKIYGKFYSNAGTGVFDGKIDYSGVVGQLNYRNSFKNGLTYDLIDKDNYEQLLYIESDGNQWINTNVSFDANWDIDIQFKLDGVRRLMGYGGSGNEYWGVQANGHYGIGASTLYYAGNRDVIRHAYADSPRAIYVNGGKIIEGMTTSPSQQYQLLTIASNDASGYGCKAKLYGCKCYYNGYLYRDFIPAVSKSTGEVGLYENESRTFYKNAGKGHFKAGRSEKLFTAPDGSPQDFVELYTRVDNMNWTGKASIRNNKGILMDEFIEE